MGASLSRPFIGIQEDGTFNRKYLLQNETRNNALRLPTSARRLAKKKSG